MEWKVERGERRCQGCEAQFQEGDEYYSALLDHGVEFERRDYCHKCWDQAREGAQTFSFWKTRIPFKEEEKKLFVDDAVIFEFFERLENEQEASRVNFRYLLALILMRKKGLKFTDIQHEGGDEFLILKQPKTDREFRVFNPRLSEEQLEQVQQDIGQILDIQF